MTNTILQINYHFTSSPAEHVELLNHVVEAIAAVPGLVWKVWLMNEAEQEAGGVYLFESREAVQAYLNSPIVTGLDAHPAIKGVSAKIFDTNEALDLITRAPLTMKSTT